MDRQAGMAGLGTGFGYDRVKRLEWHGGVGMAGVIQEWEENAGTAGGMQEWQGAGRSQEQTAREWQVDEGTAGR